ncbi:MAG TPA: glycerol kinase GlpK [Acidimicrobiales bacterium]|jgi:glycerol kinase|nr:glycerol kinase GlpK [Acidimicrobiales bacterium]
MAAVLAIDAGTTGVRTLAVADTGDVITSAYREFPQYFPRPGWMEHDPEEIWSAVVETVTTVAQRLLEAQTPIAAIGITNQRETTVVWDRGTGRPLHRAVVWQDRRTSARCQELTTGGYLDRVRQLTGLVLDPYFSATKLEWLLTEGQVEASPDLAFGTVDSWIIWKLTGGAVHATDPSNASRTLLYDIGRRGWSDELLAIFGVPASCLPEVGFSSGRIGVTAPGVVAGLDGVPISGVAGDQQASLFGQACFQPGMTKNTYGTGSFVLMNVGPACPAPVAGLLTSVAWTLERPAATAYALEGAIFVTGAAIQWLRDGLGIIAEASEIGPLAASVDDSEGVFVVPAFAGLGSPWWDPYARGLVIGLSRGSGRAQLARAVVEAMAYQTRDVVTTMTEGSGRAVTSLRVDGGASVMDLLLQLQADQLQIPVARSRVSDTTALGAAYLAGLAEGVWSSLDELATLWGADAEAQPRRRADDRYAQWRRAVERSRGWAGDAS